jgi:cytochrome c oxidase subunit 2
MNGFLWDLFFWVSVVVYVLVLIAAAIALVHQGTPRAALRAVTIAGGLTVITLFVLLVATIITSRKLAAAPKPALNIVVTGHQWWWQIDYDDPDPSRRIATANELVIPAGIPVRLLLRSNDVIHSFWIPGLYGKRDLIPGHENAIVLRADQAGTYRGQCAEFCGQQHAKMALWANVVTPAEFSRWTAAQRQRSKIPSTRLQRSGEQVFMRSPCPLCHSILGTDASGKTGPDLTHFASRRSIAAGTLPNRRDTLAKWIVDPQHVKAGALMPPTSLAKNDLDALVAYLESLQ